MYLSISFVLCAIAYRAVQRIYEAIDNCQIPIFQYFNFLPSWKSVEFWFLRYGLYKLIKAKEKANDWIVLLDFTVQAGLHKCLVILGVRQKTLINKKKNGGSFDVFHKDFEPLAIMPVASSNGEMVAGVLEDISKQIGPFLQLVADHGGDIKKSIRLYCKEHKETVNTYDITHKLAILLKNELANDDVWNNIVKLITETKQNTKQSLEAFLSPLRQREKARFMNIDIFCDWLIEVYIFFNRNIRDDEIKYVNEEKVNEKLGWVLDNEEELIKYAEMMVIVREARHLIRTEGLYRHSCTDFFHRLKQAFKNEKISQRAFNLAKKVFFFLKQEGRQIPKGQVMLGSSEGIESVIGREKVIVERTKATRSITKNILGIAAMVGENSSELIAQALETVSNKALKDWEEKWIGKSDLSKRREAFSYGKLESEPLSEKSYIAKAI